jgi:hypothetical protein
MLMEEALFTPKHCGKEKWIDALHFIIWPEGLPSICFLF